MARMCNGHWSGPRADVLTSTPERTPQHGQSSGWTADTTTGTVTFAVAPANSASVTAGFEFDVPVRFDSDLLDVTLDIEYLGSITSIPLVEIRL